MVAIAFGVLVVPTPVRSGSPARRRDAAISDPRRRARRGARARPRSSTTRRRRSASSTAVARAAIDRDQLVALLAQFGQQRVHGQRRRHRDEGVGRAPREQPSGRSRSRFSTCPKACKAADLDLVACVAGEHAVRGRRRPRVRRGAAGSRSARRARRWSWSPSRCERRPLGRAGHASSSSPAALALLVARSCSCAAWPAASPVRSPRWRPPRTASRPVTSRARVDATEACPTTSSPTSPAASTRWRPSSRRHAGHERAFLLSISHDLRTPLTSIQGYAEAIADGTVDRHRRTASAPRTVIETEARRLERLVADLLDLARLDAHQFSLDAAAHRRRDVVATTVAGFEPSARDFGVTLRVAPGDAAPADADPERLAQIVANLVENALKYATARRPVDGRRGRRRDRDPRRRRRPGHPRPEHERVFERLYTARGAPAVRSAPGSASRSCASSPPRWAATLAARRSSGGARFVVTIP